MGMYKVLGSWQRLVFLQGLRHPTLDKGYLKVDASIGWGPKTTAWLHVELLYSSQEL